MRFVGLLAVMGWTATASAYEMADLPSAVASAPEVLRLAVAESEPRLTRAGMLLFQDPTLEDPGAMPLMLDRLLNGGEAQPVRMALASVVVRLIEADSIWIATTAELIASEADVAVRGELVSALKGAPAELATQSLSTALSDASEDIRVRAAFASGWNPSADVNVSLVAALNDAEPAVRGAAAKALGWRKAAESAPRLRALAQQDGSAEVRAEAARALGGL
jgi:HEAT repeat protein